MPFQSGAQMRWMFANKPAMAKRWAAEYGRPSTPRAKQPTTVAAELARKMRA